ncbi:hypothetical protein BGZ52_007126, partial [Haplosporangium bisporale]
LHYKHPRYYSRDHSHEAGYDSYLTGVILIKLLAYISKQNMIQREAFYAHQVMYSQASMFPPMHSPMHVPMSAPMLSSIPAPMPVSMAASAPFVKEPTPEPKAPTPEPAPKVPSPKVEEKTLVPPKKSYADLFSKPKPKPAPAPSPTKPAPTQAKPAPNQAKQAATPAKLANSAKAPVSDKLGKAAPPVKEGSLNEKAPNSAQKPAENPKTSTTLAPAPSSPAPAPSPVPLPSPAPRQFHSPPPPPPHHFMGMPLAPFDFKDPAIAVYLNLLHWGRSQSGCFDLKLYG